MKIEQTFWSEATGWDSAPGVGTLGKSAQLVLVFGGVDELRAANCMGLLGGAYPNAHIFGCTTSGEVIGTQVLDHSVTVTAVAFEHSQVRASRVEIADMEQCFEAGRRLVRQLPSDGLRHIFVLRDGLGIGKSALVAGVNSAVPEGVIVSGGFASDNILWQHTHVWCDGNAAEKSAVAIGFYGDRLRVGVAAAAGWDAFGPDRVTRSEGRVIYELDRSRALDLYKRYLGNYAAGLPASGLLFPLSLHEASSPRGSVIRAVENIDETNGSLIMGGDVRMGSLACMMTGTSEHLIDGARQAAQFSLRGLGQITPSLAVIVSCAGRRPVLKHRVDDEVQAVAEALGSDIKLTGFYSYGEIAPTAFGGDADLHNQTMTVTCFAEV